MNSTPASTLSDVRVRSKNIFFHLRLPSSRRAKPGIVNDRRTKWRGGSSGSDRSKRERGKVELNNDEKSHSVLILDKP